jgi:hypothetical protein
MFYYVSAALHRIAMDIKLIIPLSHDNCHEPHKNPFRNNISFHKEKGILHGTLSLSLL